MATRKSATEPIQDNAPVQKDVSASVATELSRRQELEFMLEGIVSIKRKLLKSADMQIKNLQAALQLKLAEIDAQHKQLLAEYQKLTENHND